MSHKALPNQWGKMAHEEYLNSMPRWNDRSRHPEFLFQALRILMLPLAVLAGGLIGWRLFLAPLPSDAAETTPTAAALYAATTSSTRVAPQPTATAEATVLRFPDRASVGSPAPDFSLPDLDGQTHALSEHLGQALLINFWATWCVPCRQEMPALQREFEAHRQEGFLVLGINLTNVDDRSQLDPFRRELGLRFPLLLDATGKVSYGLYRVISIPASVLVDRQGVVSEIVIGAIPPEKLDDKITRLLQVTP